MALLVYKNFHTFGSPCQYIREVIVQENSHNIALQRKINQNKHCLHDYVVSTIEYISQQRTNYFMTNLMSFYKIKPESKLCVSKICKISQILKSK